MTGDVIFVDCVAHRLFLEGVGAVGMKEGSTNCSHDSADDSFVDSVSTRSVVES